jgi:hypothetical protein
VLLVPGAFVQFAWIGLADNLATGLVLAGLASWTIRRRGSATVLFVLAVLARETMLLVPASLALLELVALLRRQSSVRTSLRLLALLALPASSYVAWLLVVRARLGVWPSDSPNGALGMPGVGLVSAARDVWSGPAAPLGLVLTLGLLAAGVARRPPAVATVLVGASLVASLFFGEAVWARWGDFTRVLLPASVVALVALLPRSRATGDEGVLSARRGVPAGTVS